MVYPKGWFGKAWFDADWFPDGGLGGPTPPVGAMRVHHARPPAMLDHGTHSMPLWLRERLRVLHQRGITRWPR